MNQNQPIKCVYTVKELIDVLQQEQEVLGPDALPVIIVDQEAYFIEEVANVVNGMPVIHIHTVPAEEVDVEAEAAGLAAERAALAEESQP